MSQVTIVDNILNFTKVNSSTNHHATERSNTGDYGDTTVSDHKDDENTAKSLNEEEQRVVHALTSILISGRLPQ